MPRGKRPADIQIDGVWYEAALLRVISEDDDGNPLDAVVCSIHHPMEAMSGDRFVYAYVAKGKKT